MCFCHGQTAPFENSLRVINKLSVCKLLAQRELEQHPGTTKHKPSLAYLISFQIKLGFSQVSNPGLEIVICGSRSALNTLLPKSRKLGKGQREPPGCCPGLPIATYLFRGSTGKIRRAKNAHGSALLHFLSVRQPLTSIPAKN